MSNAAAAYIRVSTEEQAREGVSLAAQEERVRAYCTMRGLDLVAVVIDAGVSAGKPLHKREGGSKVLALLKGGKVQHVVAVKLDRLFRDCADCLEVTRRWDRASVALHLIDLGGQAVDTSSAMGRFFLTVMAGAAEMERNLVSERTSTALAYKRAKGEKLGGDVPFGCKLADDGVTLERCPIEARAEELITALRADGMSIRAIAAHLNDQHVPSRGKRWHPTTVARLLKRAA